MSGPSDITLKPVSSDIAPHARAAYVLTVLAHPDVSRVGQIAWLMDVGSAGNVEVGRSEPLFRDHDSGAGAPLSVNWISRQGVALESMSGLCALRVDASGTSMEVSVEGASVKGSVLLSAEELERGVVLELARSVVLLIHTRQLELGRGSDSCGLVGQSQAVEALRRELRKVADLDVPVLLRGESGVGKELVAAAIHRASTRALKPYVCVNMAAIPESMAASELFGHARGAFTGATSAHDGYFVRADGGTLFMDEVGELSSDVQPLLLRVLETGEVQAVGVARRRAVSVRVISATDADLERAVQVGSFRLPLWQRLSGFELRVPPLRERRDDVARLFLHFLRDELAQSGQAERLASPAAGVRPWLSARFVAELVRHAWPGNVRQLRNVARQLAIANRGEARFRVDPATERVLRSPSAPSVVPSERASVAPRAPAAPKLSAPDDAAIAEHWRAAGYRLDAAAERLGVSRSWLHTRLEHCPGVRKATELSEQEIERVWSEAGGELERAAAALEVSPRALQLQRKRLRMS